MKTLLRWRSAWIGCAMLWIMLAHSGLESSFAPFVYWKQWGYGGVDICLFASGIGCWFSLDKDPDALRFLKRRVQRLAPVYLCFLPVWFAYEAGMHGYSWRKALGNVLGVQSFTGLGGSFSWYISALVLLYLLAPYLKDLADRVKTGRGQLLVLGGLLLLSVPFWGADGMIIMVTRLPIFYIGILFAKGCCRGEELKNWEIAVLGAGVVLGIGLLYVWGRWLPEYMWSYGLYWYPFILFTPGACVLMGLVFSWMEARKGFGWLLRGIEAVGRNSFEVYLVHVFLYEEVLRELDLSRLPVSQNLFWLGTIPAVALGCFLLKKAAGLVQNRLVILSR